MTKWLLRALAFAAAMVVLRVIQGLLINAFEAQSGLISVVLLLIFVAAVLLWGVLDGRADARANPDPDRRRDLATTWLVAGLVAGVIGGVVAWLVSLFDKAIYVGTLINELTTFAAFTALLVFVPAMLGAMIGRWTVDRQYAKAPQTHHGLAAHEEGGSDTDVFASVGSGHAADGGAATESARSPSGSEARTEEFPRDTDQTPSPSEAPSEAKTADIPTEETKRDDRSS
jgi:TM2 domain-containing membrane protein YozV